MEILSEFTLSQSINWLKDINLKLIERVELIESIINKNKVEESDIERLKIIDKHHYTSWDILELPLDYEDLDLCLTIYNSTILDARNKYETFFDYQNNRAFELHQYYLSKFISYNIEVDFFIHYFENLRLQLTELSLTFSGCTHESEYGFCFQNTMNLANKEPDLKKRKQIYLDAFAAINMDWIESELCFPKETDEYKSQLEHFQEYCFGCQKAIETIDFQLQNIPISTKKDFKLIYENPIPYKYTSIPINKVTNTVKSTILEKEKVLSRYLEAVDTCLRAFVLDFEPNPDDVLFINNHLKKFITALKELYFSDNPKKEEFYVLLHSDISKATFHINDDNLAGKNPNVWRTVSHTLKVAESYTSELRFKETNNYFPFQIDNSDDSLSNNNPIINIETNSSYNRKSINIFDAITINDYCEFLLGISNHIFFEEHNYTKTTKSEMFDFIKEKTNNFDLNKFNYFIDDLRRFEVPFYYKISDERFHGAMLFFSLGNDQEYNKKTLNERVKIASKENPDMQQYMTTLLVDFSDIAESEYAKALKNSEKNIQHSNVNHITEPKNKVNVNNDIYVETDYTQTHINDFCNFLMGIGNAQLLIIDEYRTFTKIKIFDYIKINTDNFNPIKFKYFIEDLRDFSNHITFYMKKNDNHTIEYDGVTGDCMEFLYNGIPAKSYHFSFNNDFTPEQVENSSFFNKVVFEIDSTLSERINLLKASIPNIHFPGTLTKLFQFSDIAEEEYSKVSGKINGVNSKLSEQYTNNEIKLDQSLIKSRFDKLKDNLSNYGFYDLPMIKSLTYSKKEELILIMSSKSVDYCIAMFDYLGYIKHLKPQYFESVKELNTEIATWLGSNERTIQGLISILKPNSKEKKNEYKSYLEVENVKNDYNRIKNS